jgi:hypothetical protein
MARGHDQPDRRTTRETDSDADSAGAGTAVADETTEDAEQSHPRPELRWVQLRQPRATVEIGKNGRILASRYHPGYDAWEVLLETYEGELSE